MKRCSRCGQENKDESRFCHNCGAELSDSKSANMLERFKSSNKFVKIIVKELKGGEFDNNIEKHYNDLEKQKMLTNNQ